MNNTQLNAKVNAFKGRLKNKFVPDAEESTDRETKKPAKPSTGRWIGTKTKSRKKELD